MRYYYDDENGVAKYMYGWNLARLRNKVAPDPRENPSQFLKIGVYKLQHLVEQKYKYLIIKLETDVKPNAKLFYTVRFWWVNADRSVKRLVDWAIYGPTSSSYIAIPVNNIVGIYRLKGYHMSSDIFIEYRVDEETLLGILRRRFATARFTKEDKIDNFKKEQEKKPPQSSGTQKPKEQISKPQKPESKPREDAPVFTKPVLPTSQETPILWILIGLGIVLALMFWIKIKNRR